MDISKEGRLSPSDSMDVDSPPLDCPSCLPTRTLLESLQCALLTVSEENQTLHGHCGQLANEIRAKLETLNRKKALAQDLRRRLHLVKDY